MYTRALLNSHLVKVPGTSLATLLDLARMGLILRSGWEGTQPGGPNRVSQGLLHSR